MARSVEIRYWRPPWLILLFQCLLYALVPIFRFIYNYKEGQLEFHDFVDAFVFLVIISDYFIYSLSKCIRSVTIDGEIISLKRKIGRSIFENASNITIYEDALCIGKYYSISLNDMVNKVQVKDVLSGFVKVYPKDTRAIHRLTKVVAVLFIFLIVLLLVLFVFWRSLEDLWAGIFIGIIYTCAIGFSVWTIWNLFRK